MTNINASLIGYFDAEADVSQPQGFSVTYRLGNGTLNSATETMTVDNYDISLPSNGEQFVAGSIAFNFGGKTYVDRNGQLYYSIDPTNGNGIFAGTIDYGTGKVNFQTWTTGIANTGTVLSSLTTGGFNPVDRVVLRTPQAPLKPSSFQVRAALLNGGQVSATSNDAGVIASAHIQGYVDNNTGIASLDFGNWITAAGQESQPWYDPAKVVNGKIFKPEPVLAETVIYNAVSYTFLPLDASILGLDPARLPVDGRIPVYHKGDVVVLLNDQSTTLTATSNTTTDLGRLRLAKVTVRDLGKNLLAVDKWSVDLDTGVITWGDLSGVSQPLTIIDRIQDMAVIADVQINGQLTLSAPATHNYPANSTLVASAIVFGDVFAHASNPFDQQTWSGIWDNVLQGNATLAQYNHTTYPIEVSNFGAIEERWAIIFTTSSTFNVVGEHIGQIVSGASANNDLAPVNPSTNDPYFTIRHQGWGAGWSAGNVLRFNTYQAAKPVWIIQSILQGNQTSDDYSFCLSFNGDVDAP